MSSLVSHPVSCPGSSTNQKHQYLWLNNQRSLFPKLAVKGTRCCFNTERRNLIFVVNFVLVLYPTTRLRSSFSQFVLRAPSWKKWTSFYIFKPKQAWRNSQSSHLPGCECVMSAVNVSVNRCVHDMCSKCGISHSLYMLIGWLSHPEVERTVLVLSQPTKLLKVKSQRWIFSRTPGDIF